MPRIATAGIALCLVLSACGSGSSSNTTVPSTPSVIPIIDTHVHMNADADGAYSTAVDDMDQIMVDEDIMLSLMMPPPFKTDLKASHYTYLDAAWSDPIAANSNLAILAGGGILSPLLVSASNSDGTVNTMELANYQDDFTLAADAIIASGPRGLAK